MQSDKWLKEVQLFHTRNICQRCQNTEDDYFKEKNVYTAFF